MRAMTRALGVAVVGAAVGGAGCSGLDRGASADAIAASAPLAHYERPISQAPVEEGAPVEGMDAPSFRAGRIAVSAQPTAGDLRRVRERGVGTVINLRSNKEMADREAVPFDEAAEVADLGMTYVHIPLGGDDGYSPEDVDAFARALEACDGDAIIHCASGGRARAMWSAYLIRERGWTPEQAERLRRTLGEKPGALERLLGDD